MSPKMALSLVPSMHRKNRSVSSFERYLILEGGMELDILIIMSNWGCGENIGRIRLNHI